MRHILKMGGLTRFDCSLGSHGLMRRGLSVALYHALQRQAFGKLLIEQPLMRVFWRAWRCGWKGIPRCCSGWPARKAAAMRAS